MSYHKKFGDEITFIPGAYFANMYNTREQVNRDLHDGLKRVSEIVGDGYRPKSVVAGFLSADNLRYLAEKEGIHVCQGNIWSQYAVDNGDGEGSICYPYYPSREHFCKPARGKDDFIDCVNLDGWTVDFLCARIPGARTVNGERWRSRQGVGPIETLLDMGTERGLKAMLATTATHFDDGFAAQRLRLGDLRLGDEPGRGPQDLRLRRPQRHGGPAPLAHRNPQALARRQTHHPGRVRRTLARAFQEQRQARLPFRPPRLRHPRLGSRQGNPLVHEPGLPPRPAAELEGKRHAERSSISPATISRPRNPPTPNPANTPATGA